MDTSAALAIKPELSHPLYLRLHAGFSEWLRILNFEPTSQRDMPKMLTVFLCFLEEHHCNEISGIGEELLKSYLVYLSEKTCQTKPGCQSLNYIRKQLQVIRKFSRYLAESAQESFEVNVKIRGKGAGIQSILTPSEVKRLYEQTSGDLLGLRDRAMLGLYYGCGLRKAEGLGLNVQDVLLEKELVYVRKGKGYKERLVPLNGHHKADLEHYLLYPRPYLLGTKRDDALLLSLNGGRLCSVIERIWRLKDKADIHKAIGVHTLRHSIATHLLQSGMKLEQIQRFLGHNSLESKQIYTHLIHEEL